MNVEEFFLRERSLFLGGGGGVQIRGGGINFSASKLRGGIIHGR